MTKHISQNKNEFNERRHQEINDLIIVKEAELNEDISFIQKVILKAEIKKLYRNLNKIGKEILTFEYRNNNN